MEKDGIRPTNRTFLKKDLKTKARREAGCGATWEEDAYTLKIGIWTRSWQGLRLLIYKEFGRVLMVDNVVYWDMERTILTLEGGVLMWI